jgi:hypothetical protein
MWDRIKRPAAPQEKAPATVTKPSRGRRRGATLLKIGAVILGIYATWWSIQGQISNALFMAEEAQQQAGAFSSWFAQDAGRYDLMIQAADTAELIGAKAKRLNDTWGWLMFFSHESYTSYFDLANPMLVASIRAAADKLATKTLAPATVSGSLLDPSEIFTAAELENTIRWTDAMSYVGQNVTMVAPVTFVTIRDTVAYADTDSDFSFVCFPKPEKPAQHEVYQRISELEGAWVLIRGKVAVYAATGKAQIILNTWSQVLSVRPLYAE